MLDYFSAALLGIVQGLTEFLPVSSSGHLIIVGHLLGLNDNTTKTFEVFIQLGSIFAVIWLYRLRFLELVFPKKRRGFSGLKGVLLLVLTCLPASILGLLVHSYIKAYLFSPKTVVVALIVGGLAMIIVERLPISHRISNIDDITPKFALCVGIAQCCALWPGFSRSASTIMGGLLSGAKRSVAAEYSFIAAVPIMFAATGFDLFKSAAFVSASDLPVFAVGFIVAFLSASLAIKVFVNLISKINFTPFAIYRFILAPIVYFVLS